MPRLSEPFAIAEFRALWFSRAISLLGDQLARVALAVLVYDRTSSPALTGLAYALTFLPYLAGPLFAGVGDRRDRRQILIRLDVLRTLLVAVIAIPHMPLLVVCGLLVVVTAVAPVYDAARSALVPDLLTEEMYPQGLAVLTVTTEAAQVAGFAVGGVLVATIGASTALALDATTFALAAIAVVMGVRARPPAASHRTETHWAQFGAAADMIWRSSWLRTMLTLAWLNALWMVPEGLAAPYAARLGEGATAVGLLLAAIPAGCVVGVFLLARLTDHDRRVGLVGPLLLIASVPMLLCALKPGLVMSLVLWTLCGVGTAYNIIANTEFVKGLPNDRRSQSIAVVSMGMVTGQGVSVLIAGLVATWVDPAYVVATAGGLGVVIALTMTATVLRPRREIRLPDARMPSPAAAEAPVG